MKIRPTRCPRRLHKLSYREDPNLVDILLNTKIIDERDFKEELQKQLEEIDNDDDDDDDDDE